MQCTATPIFSSNALNSSERWACSLLRPFPRQSQGSGSRSALGLELAPRCPDASPWLGACSLSPFHPPHIPVLTLQGGTLVSQPSQGRWPSTPGRPLLREPQPGWAWSWEPRGTLLFPRLRCFPFLDSTSPVSSGSSADRTKNK